MKAEDTTGRKGLEPDGAAVESLWAVGAYKRPYRVLWAQQAKYNQTMASNKAGYYWPQPWTPASSTKHKRGKWTA
jgi:hypothetical protein